MTENELRQIIGNPAAGDTLALDTTRFHDSLFARQTGTVFGTTAPRIHLDQKPVIFGPFLRLKGSVALLGVTFTGDIQLDFGSPAPRFEIHLTTPAASLRAILDTMLGGRFPLPPLLDVQTEAIDLTLDLVSGQVNLVIRTTAASLGTIAIEAHTAHDAFEFVAVAAVTASLRLSSLVPVLAPLDVLIPRNLQLILASSPAALAMIQKITIPAGIETVEEGLIATGEVAMDALGLDLLRQLTGIDHLDVRVSAGPLVFSGELSSPPLPDVDLLFITLTRPRILVRPDPLAVGLHSGAHVNIIGGVPEMEGDLRVVAGAVEAELATAEAWHNPFGVPGLTVEKVAIKGRALPAPDVTLFGDVSLSKHDSSKRMAVAVTLRGGVPVMLAGRFNEPVSLFDLVEVFFGVGGLPDVFSIVGLHDVLLSVVPPPLPVDIGGEHFDVGLRFRGRLTVLGLEATFAFAVVPGEAFLAHAELAPVNIGGFLTITGPSAQGGPTITLRAGAASAIQLGGKITLLGFVQEVLADVDQNGFDFQLHEHLGPAEVDLACRVSSEGARVEGDVKLLLNADIGPIRIPGVDVDMGTIHLAETGFTGRLRMEERNGAFSAGISGSFELLGMTFTLPEIALAVPPGSIDDLLRAVIDGIRNNAAAIFAAIFSDVDVWARMILNGIIAAITSIALVLHDVFHQTVDKVVDTMKHLLERTEEEIIRDLKLIGVTPEDTARALAGVLTLPLQQAQQLVQDVLGVHIDHIDAHLDEHLDIHADVHVDVHTDIFVDHLDEHVDIHIDIF